MSIKRLTLNNFRNHQNLSINIEENLIIINGKNGLGKTNILESISLFSPGKGFRNASLEEIYCKTANNLQWSINAEIAYNNDSINLRIGALFGEAIKKVIKANDEHLEKSNELLNYLKIVWITPQTDRIFLESPSVRRKFFDRITYNFFPQHAIYILNYEKLVKSRLKLIQQSSYDELWVITLEKQIAELNYIIHRTRSNCLNILKNHLDINYNFLSPFIKLNDNVEKLISADSATSISNIQEKLSVNRKFDKLSGRTNFGIHKADIEAIHSLKNIQADQCSTGEQKAMMISLILAQIKAMQENSSVPIIVLLDEIFSHFAYDFRTLLINELSKLKVQIWLTTTNEYISKEIIQTKQLITL